MSIDSSNLSYWEYKSWFSNVDFTIVGSGIVGLTTAINLKKRYPRSKILVLERGWLPNGASTKNAGFACFGSISEILADLKTHSEENVKALVKMRFEGLKILRDLLGDSQVGFELNGGYEVFLNEDKIFEESLDALGKVNLLLKDVFNKNFETFFSFGMSKKKKYYNDKVEVDVLFDGYFPPSQEDGRDTFEFEDKFKVSYQLTEKIRLYNLGEISKLQGKEFYKAKIGVEISL